MSKQDKNIDKALKKLVKHVTPALPNRNHGGEWYEGEPDKLSMYFIRSDGMMIGMAFDRKGIEIAWKYADINLVRPKFATTALIKAIVEFLPDTKEQANHLTSEQVCVMGLTLMTIGVQLFHDRNNYSIVEAIERALSENNRNASIVFGMDENGIEIRFWPRAVAENEQRVVH